MASWNVTHVKKKRPKQNGKTTFHPQHEMLWMALKEQTMY